MRRLGQSTLEKDVAEIRVLANFATAPSGTPTDHGTLTGLDGDDHSQYVHLSSARTITAQHQFAPGSAQAPFSLGANAQGQTVTGLKADQLNKSVTAGKGLSGGGALTASIELEVLAGDGIDVSTTVAVDVTDIIGVGLSEDGSNNLVLGTPSACTVSTTNSVSGTTHTHAVTTSSNPGAAASILASDASGDLRLIDLTLDGNLTTSRVAGHLIPLLVDTYDLGSSTLLWRKGWLSELDAILFAENTITLLGGWFYITKDAGTLGADLGSADTTCDFGKTMTPGDFVVMRAALKVEYFLVGTLVSGTTYRIGAAGSGARNLDGTGANDWPQGTPFAVFGATGDGRIELNAYDTPRVQILSQGATYNAQTEIMRFGDLDGNWGYSSQTWGLAVGEYAAGKGNMVWDPTNGLRLRTHSTTVIQLDNAGDAYIQDTLLIGANGEVVATDGSTTAMMNADGFVIAGPKTSWDWLSGYKFNVGATTYGGMWSRYVASDLTELEVTVESADAGTEATLYLKAIAPGNLAARMPSIVMSVEGSAAPTWSSTLTLTSTGVAISEHLSVAGFLNFTALESSGDLYQSAANVMKTDNSLYIVLDGRIGSGLYVGSIANDPPDNDVIADGGIYLGRNADPGDGNVAYTGALKSYKNATEYTGYIFVPLAEPLTNSSWDGDAKSDVGSSTQMDLSALFGLPAGIKAILMQVVTQDSAAWGTDGLYFACGPSETYWYALASRPCGGDVDAEAQGIVPCDANGDVWYRINASGAGTLDVSIWIWGYWI